MKVTWLGAGALAFAALLGSPSPSQAGVRVGVGIFVGHDRDRGYRNTYRIGFDRGYQDGVAHGAKDGHFDESYNFWHDRRYRHGDAGYHRRYGPHQEYVSGYRQGYEQGYRRAFGANRHQHRGQSGWCYQRHDGRDDRYDDRDDRYRDRRYDDRRYDDDDRR